MTKAKGFRQGDVLVIPTATIPPTAKPVDPENGRVVLAHGEATGHHHSFAHDRGATLFREDGTGGGAFLTVTDVPAALEHQEHTALIAQPGTYAVVRQVQWSDADEPIAVQD
jgi:hypothetical protein